MRVSIASYEIVLSRHPETVRKMFRKPKKYLPEEYEWFYEWGRRIDNAYNPEAWEPERIEIGLCAVKGTSHCRTYLCSGSVYLPPEIAQQEQDRIQEVVDERYRVEHLTPEEREREFNEALAYLMGPKNKGFIALRVGND